MAFYSDLNSYSPTTQPLLIDIQAIYQSLNNIINSTKGERLFNPEFGWDGLAEFDLINDDTASILYNDLVEAIERSEPRIVIDPANTKVLADPDNNLFQIKVVFNLTGNTDQSFEYNQSLTI